MRARGHGGSGHRAVPHTADVRVEAWGPNREECLAQAVTAMVETFADVRGVRPRAVRRARITGAGDEDLLAALLDEVVFRVEVDGEVPVGVDARATGDGALEVRLAVAPLAEMEITGAAPKGVSWSDLRVGPYADGWCCAVTIDV
nr:archease [Streptomyces sp. HPF1205]